MLRAWKQRHLHQTITLMFMLKGPKIRKAPKKYIKQMSRGSQKNIKSYVGRKICDFFCYHSSKLSPRVS